METIIKKLEFRAEKLRAALERKGGRGVDLADEIDRIEFAVASLKGELSCPHCDARLTSGK